jgi:hypothetical protein
MMEIMSDAEITSGVRELSEGILKYEGENVELVDRLLFISVSPSKLEEGFPKLHRYGQNENVLSRDVHKVIMTTTMVFLS